MAGVGIRRRHGTAAIPSGSPAAIEFVLAIAAIAMGIIALRKGERSWLTLLAFVLVVIVGGFWISSHWARYYGPTDPKIGRRFTLLA